MTEIISAPVVMCCQHFRIPNRFFLLFRTFLGGTVFSFEFAGSYTLDLSWYTPDR